MQHDLNLLRVFRALMAERSVTAAAHRLGLGQSGVSASLARLREMFGDPLFIRTRYGISPTDKSHQIAPMVESALTSLENAIAMHRPFMPETTRRTFRIMASDYAELVLMPRIAERIVRLAPKARISVLPLGAELDAAALTGGQIDLALGRFKEPPDLLVVADLFEDAFMCLIRRSDRKEGGSFDIEAYQAMGHVAVVPPGRLRTGVFAQMLDRGVRRDVRVSVTGFLQAAATVEQTGLCATLPVRIAQLFANDPRFTLLQPPVELEPFPTQMAWHPRHRLDRAHAWFRQSIVDLARSA